MIELTGLYGLPVIVESYSFGDPGKRWGPPEDCYPPEPWEVEWVVDADPRISEAVFEMLEDSGKLELFEKNLLEQISEMNDDEYV